MSIYNRESGYYESPLGYDIVDWFVRPRLLVSMSYFTFLRNHFSEKSNMDAASAAFGVKCLLPHYSPNSHVQIFPSFPNAIDKTRQQEMVHSALGTLHKKASCSKKFYRS